jgi:hypothetical protein
MFCNIKILPVQEGGRRLWKVEEGSEGVRCQGAFSREAKEASQAERMVRDREVGVGGS